MDDPELVKNPDETAVLSSCADPYIPFPNWKQCSSTRIQRMIQQEAVYPKRDSIEKIEGTVFVNFKVSADGKAHDFVVSRLLADGYDEEALRVVSLLSDSIFRPAMKHGLPVKSQLGCGVNFGSRSKKGKQIPIKIPKIGG